MHQRKVSTELSQQYAGFFCHGFETGVGRRGLAIGRALNAARIVSPIM